MWNNPYGNFLRPYLLQTIAKLTPGEFEPRHTRKQREVDLLFDRLQFIKAYESDQIGKAGRTAIGMNPLGNEQIATSAMPYRERPYFQEFVKETDQGQRKRILSMVSDDMQRALTGQWTRQYLEVTGQPSPPESNPRARMSRNYELAQVQITEAGYQVPPKDWIGYNQNVEMEDIKAVFLHNEGYDNHDFNIWDDRMISLNRKPYLKGSHEYLTSRSMAVPSFILSAGYDRRSRGMTVMSEHTSRSMTSRSTVYNSTDRRRQDEQSYRQAQDTLLSV
jgi:hypothetical protein